MANLLTQFASGQTVYALILNSSGQAWNPNSSAFETPTAANWTHYAIAMAEQTVGNLTGIYEGSFPSGITTAGVYNVLFREQGGGSPAAGDTNNGMLGGQFFWTGSAEAFPLASSAANSVNVAMSAANVSANVAQIAGVSASGMVVSDSHGNSVFSATTLENTPAGGGNVNVTAWNGTAVSLSDGLPSVQAANLVGSGPIAINQNTGGTDNLRYVDSSGNGVEGANILIYLATDWPANPDRVQATAITGPDGRWLSPAFVDSGTYVAVFTKIGADGPDVSAPFSV
jgi:hypothetical protein